MSFRVIGIVAVNEKDVWKRNFRPACKSWTRNSWVPLITGNLSVQKLADTAAQAN